MKRKIIDWAMLGVGIVLLIAGAFCVKTMNAQTFPYVCIGLGCGLFGHGIGGRIESRAVRSDPALARRMEIDKNDERNAAITNGSKAKAFDLSLYVFSALMLAFCLMNVETPVILLLTAAYLVVTGYWIYCRVQMDRKM